MNGTERDIAGEFFAAARAASPEAMAQAIPILRGTPPTLPPGPMLVRPMQAVKLTGLSRSTLYRMARMGRLETVEVLPGCRRFRRADLAQLLGLAP